MEPVTHLLTGGCLARAGFNRTAAYATMTMVLAAELPDVDTLWGLRGPIEGFQHHRGITHTLLGLPFEAAFLVAAVYGWHRWRVMQVEGGDGMGGSGSCVPARRPTLADDRAVGEDGAPGVWANAGARVGANGAPGVGANAGAGGRVRRRSGKVANVVPVRWGVLYGLALVGLLSHLLLDYTNNYGLRPFFPFDDRWYAGSIVFIFDPVMFAMLVGALTVPWLFGLVGSEVGAKRQAFPARGWAIAALLGVVGWWGLREVEHGQAVRMAMAQSVAAPVDGDAIAEAVPRYLQAQRALASPDPMSPFRWSAVMDFGPMYQMAEVDTKGDGTLTMGQTTYPKPGRSRAVLTAEGSKLGRVYMDWSPMPIVEVTQADGALAGEDGVVAQVVTFRDPRFMGGWMQDAGRTALEGTVGLDAAGRVVRETMDGRVER